MSRMRQRPRSDVMDEEMRLSRLREPLLVGHPAMPIRRVSVQCLHRRAICRETQTRTMGSTQGEKKLYKRSQVTQYTVS